MCYHRRTIHACHHMSMGAIISSCSRRPSTPTERCSFQWSRAIFTVRSASKCRACVRIDGVLSSIAELVTTSALRMERVDDFKAARAEGREKTLLAHQKPWNFWNTEDTRKGRPVSCYSSIASPSISTDEGCVSDESDPEDHDSASVTTVKERTRRLGSIMEEDNLDELEGMGYISIPNMSRFSI
ncbi:hypothetical protein BROUX41_006396 [Berkeleyomyces rouxiae]